MMRSSRWVVTSRWVAIVSIGILGCGLIDTSRSARAEESLAWGKGAVATPAPAPESPKKKKKEKKKKKKESITVIEEETPKDVRERTVRGNEPLTPEEQSTTVDSDNVFSRTWRGFRRFLADRGVQIDPVYKGDVAAPISGGIGRKTTHLGNIDLKASINAEKLIGWKGATIFAYGLIDYGGHPGTEVVGNTQGVDNIEVTAGSGRLYEFWVQQAFADEKVSLLAGLHDLNSEFYATETSSLFLNPSFGIGKDLSQTGRNGPSIFPVTSLALRGRFEPTPQFYLETAAFDAVSGAGNPRNPRGTHASLNSEDGILSISEMAWLPGRGADNAEHGKFAAGIWNYTKTFDHLTQVDGSGNPVQDTSHGFYLSGEHSFAKNYAAFVRFGKASSAVNSISSNWSAGLVATGLIPIRADDRVGLAVTQARAGEEAKEAAVAAGTPIDSAETIYEATYRFEFGRGIALQLDYQFIKNPNLDPTIQNAKIGITRLEVDF